MEFAFSETIRYDTGFAEFPVSTVFLTNTYMSKISNHTNQLLLGRCGPIFTDM